MPSAKSDARWGDALFLTVALWLFIVLIFLPGIIVRHSGDGWFSIFLDASTVVVSMSLGLFVFAVFRATLEWPTQLRIFTLATAVFSVAVAHASFDLLYTAWVAQNVEASWFDVPINFSRGYEAAFRYLLVFAVNLALFQMAFTRRSSTRSQRQLADARSAAQQAQLQALRYQLNPHFLFNTLNSISSLIVTRRNEDAEEMTSKLSSFLRSSLTCDPTGLVPLEEELALIEEYLDIEGVRFGKRLIVSIGCQPEAGAALIPSFLVQPLVENAIKHGVARSREPVTVRINATLEAHLLCITVENDSVPAETGISGGTGASGGTGVGLVNVRQRLKAVFGDAASLTTQANGSLYIATICIPDVQESD
ncbi:MAG: histidine kinase [Alphaproteobacteria bacterium]|nr:histidine kinase [Alphaproteobacteria bacterium]